MDVEGFGIRPADGLRSGYELYGSKIANAVGPSQCTGADILVFMHPDPGTATTDWPKLCQPRTMSGDLRSTKGSESQTASRVLNRQVHGAGVGLRVDADDAGIPVGEFQTLQGGAVIIEKVDF